LGLVLDEDKNGNVFVTSIDANRRAEKSGKVFVGDQVMMVSATFGDDLWSCEGVGLTRVLSCITLSPLKLIICMKCSTVNRLEIPSQSNWC